MHGSHCLRAKRPDVCPWAKDGRDPSEFPVLADVEVERGGLVHVDL